MRRRRRRRLLYGWRLPAPEEGREAACLMEVLLLPLLLLSLFSLFSLPPRSRLALRRRRRRGLSEKRLLLQLQLVLLQLKLLQLHLEVLRHHLDRRRRHGRRREGGRRWVRWRRRGKRTGGAVSGSGFGCELPFEACGKLW